MSTIHSERSGARGRILEKLKAQVAGADYGKLPAEPSYAYPPMSRDAALARFTECLQANHAEVIEVSAETIPLAIERELVKRNISKLICGQKGKFSGSLESYFSRSDSEGIELVKYDFPLSDNKSRLFDEAPASFTHSRCSIAATGTIVLWPSEDEPRTLSLVPPLHFVLVDTHKMVSDFATLLKSEHWGAELPANVLLISGPSKTADIQQTLAYGAHGPKELVVLLLNNNTDKE
ncbi:lactate utilization protein [Alteromonas aestuariivivens]|uniref:Lactate utilization protein n=1 Tax=Alteromonas aestuariivivens TaxID=1938339 RepID=A0A3D8M6P8_9ALTE|nr:lactate utilization protein [Alteromonas aestuariivivens]RDV25456.1 lactate utilization protein [Alteromonas aestuariivivens]